MTSHVPLAKDKHANLKVINSGDYSRFKNQNLIPIVSRDFFILASEFPCVFVTNQDSEEFMPVAIMGLREGQNLYCQQEPYPAQVIPVGFGNAPFAIAAADAQRDQFVVLVDEDSHLLSETEGQALFDENGEKTEYMESRVEGLVQAAQQREQTIQICKLLKEKNLLATQIVQLQHRPDGQRYSIDGIYTVDENKLNELPDEEFLELRKIGLIAMIYAHLTSLQQLRRISERQYEADKAAGMNKQSDELSSIDALS
ncbi:MAG: SapC family protein [Pseudomonadales bacterium]|nr:SapC family protein [Pseudomonadales bacterium]